MTEQEQLMLDGVLRDEPFICVHDGYAYFLGPEAPTKLNWLHAMNWCKFIGDGYELPNKEVLTECYKNKTIKEEFKPVGYWSSTADEKYKAYVWFRDFGVGHLVSSIHTNFFYGRSVRKIKI